jgi:hypothetical protein
MSGLVMWMVLKGRVTAIDLDMPTLISIDCDDGCEMATGASRGNAGAAGCAATGGCVGAGMGGIGSWASATPETAARISPDRAARM